MRAGDRRGRLALGIGEKREFASGGDAGVELPQAAGGGVARIGEFSFLALIQGEEIGLGHIDLAANFNLFRRVLRQGFRQRLQGQQVLGNILAFTAIAARGGANKFSVLIGEGNRQAVDFGFRHEVQWRCIQAEKSPDFGTEISKIFRPKHVVEREHRH